VGHREILAKSSNFNQIVEICHDLTDDGIVGQQGICWISHQDWLSGTEEAPKSGRCLFGKAQAEFWSK